MHHSAPRPIECGPSVAVCPQRRELLSPCHFSSGTQLVSGYSNDNDTTKILDTFDVYGLPVANPDGYEYTHILVSHERFACR